MIVSNIVINQNKTTKEKGYKIIAGRILYSENADFQLNFSNEMLNINISAMITTRGNKAGIAEKCILKESFKGKYFDKKIAPRKPERYLIS